MRRYVLNVVIEEGQDEFWESLKGSGCDEITRTVTDSIEEVFEHNCHVELMAFKETKEFQNQI